MLTQFKVEKIAVQPGKRRTTRHLQRARIPRKTRQEISTWILLQRVALWHRTLGNESETDATVTKERNVEGINVLAENSGTAGGFEEVGDGAAEEDNENNISFEPTSDGNHTRVDEEGKLGMDENEKDLV